MSSTAKKFRQALASHQSGQLTAAEHGYRKILAKTPQDITVLYHLGIVLHQQAKTAAAKDILTNTVTHAPDFPEAHYSLGVVLLELGNHNEAEAALRKATTLRPNMQSALARLGELLVQQKKYAEAVPLLQKAIQLRDNDAKAWLALCIAFRFLGDIEQALEAGYRSLALNGGDDNHAHSQLADLIYMHYRHQPPSARLHAQRWIAAFPSNPFAQHVGPAVLGIATPERAGNQYVKTLFDNFSESFEESLTKLGYCTFEIVPAMAELHTLQQDLVILDAGCGTGLAGASLRPAARKLIGVDISPRMLEKARDKGVYDELVEMELGDYLQSHQTAFDLIAASDVFNYFGKLSSIVSQAAHALRPKGKLAFSVECGDDEASGFKLGPHGRYSHNQAYLIDVIRQSGLQLNKIQRAVLRKEFENEVTAFLVLASKPE